MTYVTSGYYCERCGMHPMACRCAEGPFTPQEDEGEETEVTFMRGLSPDDAAGEADDAVALLLAEMLDTDALDHIPALEPIIEDTLFLDSPARLYGESGSFKSFVALDFAGCVGTGKDWHGLRVRQGTVVYLVAEGVKGMRKRVRAWEQHYGRKMTGVRFLPRPVQVRSTEWRVLIEACRRLAPSLIIIDTQARVTVGVEENSATEMGIVNDLVEQLRAACEACVLMIHHSGVNGDRARGSTSVKGAMQTELSTTRKGKGLATEVTLRTGKQKDDEEAPDMLFRLGRIELTGEAKEDGSPVTSVVLVPAMSAHDDEAAPGSIEFYIDQLDKAGVPILGRDKTRTEASKRGIVLPGNDKLSAIVRLRKQRYDLSQETRTGHPDNACPGCGDSYDVLADHTCPGQLEDRSGQPTSDLSARSLSRREGTGRTGRPGETCSECGWSVTSTGHIERCGVTA